MSAYSYTKLFSSITESTVWCEPAGTRLVWITLLAKCDMFGRFSGSIPGLARLANVSLEDTTAAMATLLSPDRYSRTPDHEGRRLEVIEGGWRLLNHEKYRELRDEERRRIQNREAKRKQRERGEDDEPSGSIDDCQQGVSNSADSQHDVSTPPPMSAHADATAPAPATALVIQEQRSRGSRLPEDWQPSDSEVEWAKEKRPDLKIDDEIEMFCNHWTAKSGKDATKTNWSKTWRNWVLSAWTKGAATPKGSSTRHGGFQERAYGVGGDL